MRIPLPNLFICILLPIFFAFMIFMMSTSGCVTEKHIISEINESINIVSLDRDIMTSGHFSLGSGSVKSTPVYFYYVQLPNTGYKLRYIPTSKCTIFMDENTTPYIKGHYYSDELPSQYLSQEWLIKYSGDVGDDIIYREFTGQIKSDNSGNIINGTALLEYERVQDIEIHIPSNSIIKEYSP